MLHTSWNIAFRYLASAVGMDESSHILDSPHSSVSIGCTDSCRNYLSFLPFFSPKRLTLTWRVHVLATLRREYKHLAILTVIILLWNQLTWSTTPFYNQPLTRLLVMLVKLNMLLWCPLLIVDLDVLMDIYYLYAML